MSIRPADDQPDIRVVLFDVGGVLVELSGVATLLDWLDHRITAQELWSLWLHSPSVRAFETGRVDAGQFAFRLASTQREMRPWVISRFSSTSSPRI